MQLDYLTLAIVVGIVAVVAAIVMTVSWRINRYEKGVGFWSAGAIICATGFLLLWLKPYIGNYSIFLNNTGTLTAFLVIFEGILRYRGFGSSSKRIRFIPLFIIFFMIISFLNRDDPTMRYLFHDPIAIILFFLSAYFLIYRTKGLERIVHLVPASAFLLLMSGFIYRWYLAVTGEIGYGFPPHPFMITFFLVLIVWGLGWTYGLSMAVNFRVQQRIIDIAGRDELTGLPNRRNMNETIENLVRDALINKQKFFVFLLDANGLKQINDSYGHAFGDKVLTVFAGAIKESIREGDFSARIGGDEFVIIIKPKTGREDIGYFLNRIRSSIEKIRIVNGKKVQLRVSQGFAVFPDDGSHIDKLLAVADRRMYEEKTEDRKLTEVL